MFANQTTCHVPMKKINEDSVFFHVTGLATLKFPKLCIKSLLPLHVYGLSSLYRHVVQSRTTVTYYPRYFILHGFPVLKNLYLQLLDGELFLNHFFESRP